MNILRGASRRVAACCMSVLLLASMQGLAGMKGSSFSESQDHDGSRMVESSGIYTGLDVIDLEQMSAMRGGFSIGGLELKFGATLRTLIDHIKLETVFNITKNNVEVVSQVLSGVSGLDEAITAVSEQSAMSASQVASASEIVENSSIEIADNTSGAGNTVLVGPDTGVSITDVAPVGVSLDGFSNDKNFSGIAVSNHKGFTAVLHKLTRDAAISAVVSNASGLRVKQKLDIKIEIANTRAARSAAKAAALSNWANRR